MAQSVTSPSIGHPGRSGYNHHPPQGINATHPNHHIQHSHSMHSSTATHVTSTSQTSHHKSTQENDQEAIARKKKNADAQAAFRQRRQTYIRSLEDTVTELKNAVTEMEKIVKTTSHEVKLHRQQVEYLEGKMAAYDSGEMRPGFFEHCKCCRFSTHGDSNPSAGKEHQGKSLSTPSTSTLPINSDCPTPSILTASHPIPQDGISREWPSRQVIPSMYQAVGAGSRSIAHPHQPQDSSNDPPHSIKSLDLPRNILHNHSGSFLHNSSFQRSNCDLNLYNPFGAPDNGSIPHFSSVAEDNHPASSQPAPHNSSPNGVCNSLELVHQPTHLQPILGHSYDRSPPLCQPTSLGTTYPPLGQSFDRHHSGTLSSPRMWTSSHHNNHTTGSGPHLDGSPRPALYPLDGAAGDPGSSAFRMHHGINECSIMRSTDYIPSLEHRSVAQSYPMISTLASPGADTSASTGGATLNRATIFKRHREWPSEKLDSKHDTRESNGTPKSIKASGVGKLNGLPAKVAQCAQVVFEVTKTVSHAKEECQSITATPSTTISAAHHSLSPNSTVNGFVESPDPSRENSKFQRDKLNALTRQLVSPVSTLAPPHSQLSDEQQAEHSNPRRYHSLIGN